MSDGYGTAYDAGRAERGWTTEQLLKLREGFETAAQMGKQYTFGQSYLSTETQILNKAVAAITGDRAESYGPAEDSFETIAQLWNTYAGTDLDAEDVAMMLVLMKVARQMYKHKDDNLVDIAGYAALAARIHDKANGSE